MKLHISRMVDEMRHLLKVWWNCTWKKCKLAKR